MAGNETIYMPNGGMETITPKTAMQYLKFNNDNPRKTVNRRQVESYARDMKAGQWFANGEPIVFDANGNLKNGQHRLMAIVLAGVPVDIYVIRGVNPDYTTYDYGLGRKLSRELGVSNNAEVIANMIVTNAYALGKPSKGVVRSYILQHNEALHRAVALSQIGSSRAPGKKRDVYAAIYLMLRCGESEDEIEQFMRVVNTQFMLTSRESSSAIVLFKYLGEIKHVVNNRSDVLNGLATVMAAFADFSRGVKRTRSYKILDTLAAQNMLTQVRRADGLED